MPLINGDAKQLEWRTALYLSQDQLGIQEVKDKVDIHDDNRVRFRLPSRLIAKTYLFRLIFGGSAWSYANDYNFREVPNGSEKFWQSVIDETYLKYKGLGTWHNWLMEEVERNEGLLVMPTGRTYLYKKKTTETARGTYRNWPRTTILNYPVQGLGADIMALARVSLMKKLHSAKRKSLLISTVHDSILIDSPKEEVPEVTEMMFQTFDDIPRNFDKLFKPTIPWNIPMEVEVQTGHTWGDMNEIKRGYTNAN